MTLGEAEKLYTTTLSQLYGLNEAKSLAWLAISFVCKINRPDYLSSRNEELSFNNETALLSILEELKSGKPLQYVLGETTFYDLTFKVNPSVLIPRPETEELVDWILKDTFVKQPNLKILDIGTGSGCIAIALKKNLPLADVLALDVSAEALETATVNSILNKTEIKFIQDDILNPRQHIISNTIYSVIVSNPPYVMLAEKKNMHRNVLNFEPHTALFVPDNDALLFYKAIVNFAAKHLQHRGLLFLEINEDLGEETLELITEMGFKNVELRKDLRGKDRMIRAEWK